MTKLTEAQERGLKYFLAVETGTNRTGRFQRRYSSPDPRVIARLAELKLIAVDGYHYGPLFKLTEAGRAAAQQVEKCCGLDFCAEHTGGVYPRR